jgi:metal transporter CNNM
MHPQWLPALPIIFFALVAETSPTAAPTAESMINASAVVDFDENCGDLLVPSDGCCKVVKSLVSTRGAFDESCKSGCAIMTEILKATEVICLKIEADAAGGLPFGVSLGLVVALVLLSGLFSGLTLGLMGLDKIGMDIVSGAGRSKDATPEQRQQAKYAMQIKPIRDEGNQLLCTLLLGNVAVNAMLSILLANMSSGLMGFLVSTIVIVIFGEILPQAFCARNALWIGSKSIPIVKLIMMILYPATWPIARILDKALGAEIGTIHEGCQLINLLKIHVDHQAVDTDVGDIMIGAVTFKDKLVKDVMTPIDKVYMLSMDDKLNFKTIANIFKSGFSRVPIYGENKDDMQGLLFTKDLIFIDPEDDTPVQQFVQVFGRSCITTHPGQTLGKLLKQLKSGRSHMALVQQMAHKSEADGGLQYREQVGVCTLEDVIEEILQDEIIDETDVFKQMNAEKLEGVDRDRKGPLDRAKEQSQENTMLRLLDSRIVDDRLSSAECKAVSAHLMLNYSHIFGRKPDRTPYTKHEVENLIYNSKVVEYPPIKEDGTPRFLYHKDQVNTFCTVVLTGKVEINAGKEVFQSFCGPWAVRHGIRHGVE